LWFTLRAAALALAIWLPSCAAMLSLAASDQEQGRAMGNNESTQVGAGSLSGLAGGALVAILITLPLLVFAGVAVTGQSPACQPGAPKISHPNDPRPRCRSRVAITLRSSDMIVECRRAGSAAQVFGLDRV
jgi:hypothetical protein